MNNYEAIGTLQCALGGGCSQICNTKYRGDCTDEEVLEALRIAIQSISKQNKRKPLIIKQITGLSSNGEERFYLEYRCCKCKYNLSLDFSCCPICETRIDWSEVYKE